MLRFESRLRRPATVLCRWTRPACTALLVAPATLAASPLAGPPPQDNLLVLVADDLGVDRVRAYGHRNAQGELIAPRTRHLDRLAGEGILFRNAWAAPACSTARAEGLTGRYPNRSGVGGAIGSPGSGDLGLHDQVPTIADLLPPSYRSAVVGKWHLAGSGPVGSPAQGVDHAPRCGFDVHVGTFANLGSSQSYFDWILLTALATTAPAASQVWLHGTYATTYTVDSALRVIHSAGDDPWFLWVSFHAPHAPLHVPPAHLVQSPGLDLNQDLGRGKAMVEALDTEIGRLLDGLSPELRARTTVLFFGDNGTQQDLVEPPFLPGRSKGTVYEGGVHVPLIVSSPRTPAALRGSECGALVDLTDLLPTALELAGSEPPAWTDGESLLPYLLDPGAPPRRRWIYAERFKPNFVPQPGATIGDRALERHHQAVRGDRYKLIRMWHSDGLPEGVEVLEFYDLESDPFEVHDLLDAFGRPPAALQAEFDALLQVVRSMAR